MIWLAMHMDRENPGWGFIAASKTREGAIRQAEQNWADRILEEGVTGLALQWSEQATMIPSKYSHRPPTMWVAPEPESGGSGRYEVFELEVGR